MKYKIRKYVKCIISVFMICSLIFPSFSASSGEGSAFITKEEFDIALSDFNKRLTAFEAGINSKIDLQVSSYLDRNGIWNASPETFDGLATNFITPDTSSMVFMTHTTVDLYDKEIVNKFNKQGLCYVQWRLRCPTPVSGWRSCLGYRYEYLTNAGAPSWAVTTAQNDINYDLLFSQGSEVKTIQSLAKCNSVDGSGRMAADFTVARVYFLFWYIPKNYYNGTSMFFVEKGKNLNIKIRMTYFFFDANNQHINWVAHESSNCEFQVTGVDVY